MNERDTDEIVEVIDIETPAADLTAESKTRTLDAESAPTEESNPDAWLQWALIIGLLVLFLICALLILIGWNGR